MRSFTCCELMVLAGVLLCGGKVQAQPSQPTKYATIDVGAGESVQKLAFSPTGDILAYLYSGKTIATWDVKTKQQEKQVFKAKLLYLDMDYSPDGATLAASGASAVFQIDLRTGETTLLYRHKDYNGEDLPVRVGRVRFSRDGKRIISGARMIRVWDVEKKAELAPIDCGGHVLDLTLIPNTDRVFASVDATAPSPLGPNLHVVKFKSVLVDVKSGKVETLDDNAPLMLHRMAAVTHDGKLAAVPDGEGLQIVSTSTWKAEKPAPPKCPVAADLCLFSPSGRQLFAAGTTKGVHTLLEPPGEVAILERTSNMWVSLFKALDREVTSLALSPNGHLLAVASSKLGTITVWDLSPVIAKAANVKKDEPLDRRRR